MSSAVPAAARATPAAPAPDASLALAWSPRAAFRRWWQARLPQTDLWALGQRNIYILPTRAGFTFAATLVVMLLASINYQLNLGFALTFLLAGAGIVSMHMTHGTLRGLTLQMKAPEAVFAGEPALLEIVLTNPGRERHGIALRFEAPEAAGAHDDGRGRAWCDVPALGAASVHLALVPPTRGWHAVPVLVAETVFPFGLFRAWTIWRPAARVLAWPQPEQPAPPLPTAAATTGHEQMASRADGGEFDGVRPWRRGDTMRQVVWKKVARAGELVSRDATGHANRELWLEWNATTIGGTEARLSRLAAWVIGAHREGLPFGVRLPGAELAPSAGDAHRRAALDLLGTWGT